MCPYSLGVNEKRITSMGWTPNASWEKLSSGLAAAQLHLLNGVYIVATSPQVSRFPARDLTNHSQPTVQLIKTLQHWNFAPFWELRVNPYPGGGKTHPSSSLCNGRTRSNLNTGSSSRSPEQRVNKPPQNHYSGEKDKLPRGGEKLMLNWTNR